MILYSTILYITNIIIILGLVFYLVFLVADRHYGLIKSICSYLLFKISRNKNLGNDKGIMWYYHNPIYFFRMVFITVLLLLNITLIGQLMNSVLFNRTEWLITLSPICWGLVLINTYLTESKKKITNGLKNNFN